MFFQLNVVLHMTSVLFEEDQVGKAVALKAESIILWPLMIKTSLLGYCQENAYIGL